MMLSINRALSEIKLLNKKIEDKTGRLEVASAVVASRCPQEMKDDFIKSAYASIESVRGLIQRRNDLKSAVVLSNAKTIVTIDGKAMTVAEAIERKTSIELEKTLNRTIREKYYSVKKGFEQHNDKAQKEAEEQVGKALEAATEGDKSEQYKKLIDATYDSKKAVLLAPENIEKDIELHQDNIDEFESEVDFILSESNTKTTIDVE